MSTLRAVHYLELCTDFIGSDGFWSENDVVSFVLIAKHTIHCNHVKAATRAVFK